MKKALVLGIPYEKTASFRKGTLKGPEKILECFSKQLEAYDRISDCKPVELASISTQLITDIEQMTPEHMVSEVSARVAQLLSHHNFVVHLGGEHSVTIPVLYALSQHIQPQQVTVLQIDAHFDLRDSDGDYNTETPSQYAHCCTMRRALDAGYRIVPVGIRAYADFERSYAKQRNVKYFEWPQTESHELIQQIISVIDTQFVYITIDVDGFDPSVMPATGTPVPGGTSWQFVVDLLKSVFAVKTVLGADIVEVAPFLDNPLTEYSAAQLAYSMIGLKFNREE